MGIIVAIVFLVAATFLCVWFCEDGDLVTTTITCRCGSRVARRIIVDPSDIAATQDALSEGCPLCMDHRRQGAPA